MNSMAYSYCRFSSRAQDRSASFDRQIEKAAAWASKKNLILDTRYKDLGKSGFKGLHRTQGSLGVFLAELKEGRIPKHSYLVVEAWDRLGREPHSLAYGNFLNIVNSGVTVVTLEDGKEITANRLNSEDGLKYEIMGKIDAAHKFSARLSERVQDAKSRQIREARLSHKPLGAGLCPAWLELSSDRTCYVAIPDRVAVVKRIYDLCIQGYGVASIAQKLNEDGIKRFTKNTGWQSGYVSVVLNNRSVMGEYSPYKWCIPNKGTKPIQDAIPNYYPAIITPEVFNAAKARRANNVQFGGSPKGGIKNLFSGLLRCSKCNSKMLLIDKGKTFPGTSITKLYLRCDSASRHTGCSASGSIGYNALETGLLSNLGWLGADIWVKLRKPTQPSKAEADKLRIETALEAAKKRLERLLTQFGDDDTVLASVPALAASIRTLEGDLLKAIQKLPRQQAVDPSAWMEKVKSLQAQAIAGDESARMQIRTAFREMLGGIICDTDNKTVTVKLWGENPVWFVLDAQGKVVGGVPDGIHLK